MANERTLELPGVPTSVEDLLAVRDELAESPYGGAAVYVLAQLAYSQDPELGLACLTVALTADRLVDGDKGYKGKQLSLVEMQAFRDRIGRKPYIARSYIQGTSPEGAYALPEGPLRVRIKEQTGDVTAERAKLFVYSTGADSPRPLTLLPNNRGLWKVREWSSLQVGVRPPVEVVDDDI